MGKILTGELPFERSSSGFPVILEIEETLGEGVEIGQIVGSKDLPLDNREIDFDLVEPAGMSWGVYEHQACVLCA